MGPNDCGAARGSRTGSNTPLEGVIARGLYQRYPEFPAVRTVRLPAFQHPGIFAVDGICRTRGIVRSAVDDEGIWWTGRPIAPSGRGSVRLGGRAQRADASAEPGNRSTLDLCGEWQFRVDPEDVGVGEQWYQGNREFPRQLRVPGAWNAQGVQFETKEQLERYLAKPSSANLPGLGNESNKLFHVYPGPAWYRRVVRIPDSWQAKTVWLKFGGVHRNADVWIGGKHVGNHVGYVVPFEFDVTEFVSAGKEATITLRVDARRNPATDPLLGCMDTLDFLYLTWGGIHRGIELCATDNVWIDDVFVVPHVREQAAEVRIAAARRSGGASASCAQRLRSSTKRSGLWPVLRKRWEIALRRP